MPGTITFIVGGIFLSILIGRWARTKEAKARQQKLNGRPSLSPSDIFQSLPKSYPFSREEFVETWNAIAKILQVDPGVLRPEDSLKELDVGTWFFTNDFYHLEIYLTENAIGLDEWQAAGELPDVISAVKFACEKRSRTHST